jgi:hypothetical protein
MMNVIPIYEEKNEDNNQNIQVAEIYTGEINTEENYPEATVIENNNETTACCDKERSTEGLCISFIIFIIFLGFLIYISIPQQ